MGKKSVIIKEIGAIENKAKAVEVAEWTVCCETMRT